MKRIFVVLAAVVLVSACATELQQEVQADETSPDASAKSDTVRYGRYTQVSTAASTDQTNLLSQIVDTRIPPSMSPTIREALNHVTQRTGYAICPPPSPEVETLYSRPLPAAHYHIGPAPLRNALQLIAGPAYNIEVNEITRTICFSVKANYKGAF
ncbi:MAG: PilL N-terminal domain-containing protein [Betaproteobacteria bacterium]|nr:PilL N-terminal domain-containing protein [Betaproteobacteria bacterium]